MEFVDHCEITQVHQGAVDQVRQVLPPDEVLSDLADLFKIFGDSTRIKILYALLRSELCVCDIADLLGLDPVRHLPPAAGPAEQQAGQISPGWQDPLLFPGRRARLPHHQPGDGTRGRVSGGFLSLRITFAYALAEEGDRRAVAEETAVPAYCAFLEGAVPPSNRVPSRPAVSRWTRW